MDDYYDVIINNIKKSSHCFIYSLLWPILYILIVTTLYSICISNVKKSYYLTLIFIIIQIKLNEISSIAFLEDKNKALSMHIYITIMTSVLFYYLYKKDTNSYYILIPYLVWLLFSFYLYL